MSISLQTPTRGRLYSQEDAYFTPTSAHISRFQRQPSGQSGTIPFVLPSVKPGMTSGGEHARSFRSQSQSRVDKENINSNSNNVGNNPQDEQSLLSSPKSANRSRTRSRPQQPVLTGSNVWQDASRPCPIPLSHASAPTDGSPLKQSFKLIGWTSSQKPRMGRRSITFPMSANVSGDAGDREVDMGSEEGSIGIGSPVRRRFNSDHSGSGSGGTRSPLRAIGISNTTSLDPPGTPSPAQTDRSPTPLQKSRPRSPSQGQTTGQLLSAVLPPPTPSGGLRRKSKFISKHASRLSTKPFSPPEKIRVQSDVRGSVEIAVENDVETEVEVEVDIVERGVIRTGSWVSEAFGEDDDALMGASQDCADLAGSSQDVAVASQTLTKRSSPLVELASTSLRRSARLSAGRTSASPRPDHMNDLFEASNDSFVSASSSSSGMRMGTSKKVVGAGQEPSAHTAKPATPKPSVRRRKRSSDVATVTAGSVGMTYESPNPRAKKNARKSVVIVEIPTAASRSVGSPMRGVVRTSGARPAADPVTPQRTAPVKRAAPATDKPASKESRRSNKSETNSPPHTQGRATGKGRNSLGAQLDKVQREEDKKKTGTSSKRRKGRKSLAPAFVVQNLHSVLDHPLRPTSPTEDPLLLVGSEEASSSRRGSRKSTSSTPRPGKEKSKRKSKQVVTQQESDASLSSPVTPLDETANREQVNIAPASGQVTIEHQTPHAYPSPSPVQMSDRPPRTSSPAYREFREYSPPNEENWQSLEFSGFGEGACDSSPPARAASAGPSRHSIEPSLIEFTLATASTPLRTPISKRRISTPHHGPIPSSTPARPEDDRTPTDEHEVWEDADEGIPEDYASEGEFRANDRESSPVYEDAEDVTAQVMEDRIEQVDSAETEASDTTLPAAAESDDDEEEEEEEEEKEETRDHTRIQDEAPPCVQPTVTDDYITIRTVVIKAEDEELDVTPEEVKLSRSTRPDDRATKNSEEMVVTEVIETATAVETIETVKVVHNQPVSDKGAPSSPTTSTNESTESAHAGDVSGRGAQSETTHKSGSVEDNAQQPESHGDPQEMSLPETPELEDEARSTDQETEISLGAERTTNMEVAGVDNDYTRAPITISSQDPRAAALAAAILRRSQRYIEASAAPPPSTAETNKLKRRRSQYFVSAESAAALTPDELLREAELELAEEQEERRQTRSHRAKSPGQSNSELLAGSSWSRDDWAVLNRCYRRVKRSAREKGKSREDCIEDAIDVDKVIDSFVFKKGLAHEELEHGKWARPDLAIRIGKLHRNARRKSAESHVDSMPSARRGPSTAVPGPASPVVKKTRTGEATSRPTQVEVHLDKETSESSSGSGWWGSVSKTWKRIKSSVSLSSMVQDETESEPSTVHDEDRSSLTRPIETRERQDRPVAPKPRRALPGGLSSLPIDTPMHPTNFRSFGTGSLAPPLIKAAPDLVGSSSRADFLPTSEMKQIDTRRVTTSSTAESTEDTVSQRSAAIKALFSTGASSPHFSAIPAHLSRDIRPSPLSQSVSHVRHGQTPKQPIVIPRASLGSSTSSPAVKDLVRSFEEVANRSMMSSSTEGDVSCELGNHSSVRRANSSESFRRTSAMFEKSFDAQE